MSAEDVGIEIISEMDREFHESPDRVIAIVGGAYIDDMLDRLFRAVLIDVSKEVDSLLRPDAPLGSNGARYQLAYCLGLITREQRDDMKLIAKIRNIFAHDFKATGFDTPPVKDYCAVLKQPATLEAVPRQLFPADTAIITAEYVRKTSATPREQYRTSVFALFGNLLRRLNYVCRVNTEAWFSYDPDALIGPGAGGGD
jgi:DNA-binding MltR family transcriptional regulator